MRLRLVCGLVAVPVKLTSGALLLLTAPPSPAQDPVRPGTPGQDSVIFSTDLISPAVPTDLNPSGGGAPRANILQAAIFGWREFIALTWPAVPQTGGLNTRDQPDTTKSYGDPTHTGPLVWETF